MKQCPACKSQYTDDTLQFCLQDGRPLELIAAELRDGARRPTVPEEETIVSERRLPSNAAAAQDNAPSREIARPPKGRTGLVIFASAMGTLVLIGLLAGGIWLYTRGGQTQTARNSSNVNTGAVRSAQSRASASPTPSSQPTSYPTNSRIENVEPDPDASEIVADITDAISGWENDTESLDIDDLMGRYAETVDYYQNPGASREFVRRDKERAFSMFESVNFEISNLTINAGRRANTATAEFDKAWAFEGERRSEGKVRSRLNLAKVEGRWLIDGERDIKVY